MEKKERTKYYPISLKDKKLHDEFMILERVKGFSNVDDALREVIEDSKELVEAKKKIAELEDNVNELNSDLINIRLGRSTLKEVKEDMERINYKNFKCTIKGELGEVIEYDEEENGN